MYSSTIEKPSAPALLSSAHEAIFARKYSKCGGEEGFVFVYVAAFVSVMEALYIGRDY